jgi:hypothetical protein
VGKELIYLNSAMNMAVHITNTTDFNSVTTAPVLTPNNYSYEYGSGLEDSLALGDVSKLINRVIILDLGYNDKAKKLGKWKLQFTLLENNQYVFNCAKLNGDDLQSAIITKDPRYNKIYYSFESAATVSIEPPKTDYDLCFTQYTEKLYSGGQLYPYLVRGVISNPYQTGTKEVLNSNYETIDHTLAENSFYELDRTDIIGYDWKDVDINTGNYTVYTDRNFLIKDASNYFYKLHFLDFYDENGLKGAPTFEYMRL